MCCWKNAAFRGEEARKTILPKRMAIKGLECK